jgi:hypothetical protein
MVNNQDEALVHFDGALADLRNSSAAGYPESWVARTINKLEVGIARLRGKDAGLKPEVVANQFPPTKERGSVPEPVKPVPAKKAAVVSIGKYADGFTIEGDRSTFPDKSPKGAKRVSIEVKK